MKKLIILILSVLLLFSCTTTVEKKTVVTEAAAEAITKTETAAEEKIAEPVTEPDEEEKTEPVRVPEKEPEKKEEESLEKKEEKTEPEKKEEEPLEKKEEKTEREEEKPQETSAPEETVLPREAERVPEIKVEETAPSFTPIVYIESTDVISAFNYAFGVKNMNDLLSADIPFTAAYFMRGMYDASLDAKTPAFTTLGNLQNVINEFYTEYTTNTITRDAGSRPETVESLLSLEEPGNKIDLFSYVYGFSVIRDLLGSGVDIEIVPFMAGMLDALYSPSSPLSDGDIQTAYNAYIIYLNEEYYREEAEKAEANKEKAEAFLLKNREENDVTVLENGVQILILAQDEELGSRPTQYDTVILDYNEYVLDYETGELEFTDADWGAEISVINLPAGFQSAVTNMHVGEAVRAFIPPELSGMAEGDGDGIEPNSVFIYDIALQQIL